MGDASKKASIDSLLNPLHDDHNPLLNPPHSALAPSHNLLNPAPEYPLRAASWDLPLWQQSERASIRIAARGSVQPPDPNPTPSSRKRPSDPPPPPQSKRPKPDGLRRGFTAEKRSKILHIQNSAFSLTPPSLLSQSPSCLPYPMPLPSPQKVRSLLPCHPPPHLPLARTCVVTGDNGQVNGLVTENATPLHPELQSARCMSNRYRLELFPRCVSCTRRWAGDTCRFQGIRFFLKDKQHEIVGISFLGSRYQDAPKMLYPIKWNVPLQEAHVNRMKVCIYVLLLLHSSILLLPFIG